MLVVISFAVCVLTILVLRPLCLRWGHVDKPGGHKLHEHPTPLCGGGAIVLSMAVVGAFTAWSLTYIGVIFGLLTMALLGALDDRKPISASVRLLFQGVAVLVGMVFVGGLQLESLGNLWGAGNVSLGLLTIPFTLFAAIGVINAVNMVDGIDGLAGGFALLVLALFAGTAAARGVDHTLIYIAIGSVAGFLAFNLRSPWRRRASIFLGDAGSLALGFLLTWFAIKFSQEPQASLRPITIVWIFALPLLDTGYLMISRVLRGQSPMSADRSHFHHLLLRMGLTPGRAVYVWLFVAAIPMALGILGEMGEVPTPYMLGGFVALFVFYSAVMATARRFAAKSTEGSVTEFF